MVLEQDLTSRYLGVHSTLPGLPSLGNHKKIIDSVRRKKGQIKYGWVTGSKTRVSPSSVSVTTTETCTTDDLKRVVGQDLRRNDILIIKYSNKRHFLKD